MDPGEAAVPVTVLTGFLGSGKTTLLNHILGAEHGLKVGVIVNEFGELGLDGRLIAGQRGGIIELANGCVCCTNQGDLLRAVVEIMTAQPPPEYLLVETTGLADPLPVAEAFLHPGRSGRLRLDGIITLVDAANFDRNLDHAEVAFSQIVCGDILLLNKCDLVAAESLALMEEGMRGLNPKARILRTTHAAADLNLLLGVGAFRLERFGQVEVRHGRHHLEGFAAVSFRSPRPVKPAAFQAFIERIPLNIFRGKGIFRVAGAEERWVFHQVGDRSAILAGSPWRAGEKRQTELVFIGRGIDREALLDALTACLDEQESQEPSGSVVT